MVKKKLKSEIHIPNELPTCEDRTLMVVLNSSNSVHAFDCSGKTLTELAPIFIEGVTFEYSDKEGFSFAPKGIDVGLRPGDSAHNKEHYLSIFVNGLAEKLTQIQKKVDYKKICVFVPKFIRYMVEEKLSVDIRKKTCFIEGNFYKHHPLDLVRRIYLKTHE